MKEKRGMTERMTGTTAKTLLLQTESAVSQYMSLSESADAPNKAEACALETRIDELITQTSQALNAFVLLLLLLLSRQQVEDWWV